MKEYLQKILTQATHDLTLELDPDHELRPLITSSLCLTPRQLEEIYNQYNNSTASARVEAILNYLSKSADSSYTIFRQCLVKIGREDLADRCLPDLEALPGSEDGNNPASSTGSATSSSVKIYRRIGSQCEDAQIVPVLEALGLTKFLREYSILHVISEIEQRQVSGMTVLGSELFVVRDKASQISVYNSTTYTFSHYIAIPGSLVLNKIASCSHYNCLYLSERAQNTIYRHDLSENATSNWSTIGRIYEFCVTKSYYVLVTLCGPSCIQQYTTGGILTREINLDSSILVNDPRHCVELSTGYFVVCHVHSVSIVDQEGRIIQSNVPRHDEHQIYSTRQLVVDKHNNVLVVDFMGIKILSPTLSYHGDVEVKISGQKLNRPNTVHFDESTQRLYITEVGNGRICVLQADIKDTD